MGGAGQSRVDKNGPNDEANPERILAILWQSVVDGGGDEVQEETGSCRWRRIGGAYVDMY